MALEPIALPPEAVTVWNGTGWVNAPVAVGNGLSFTTPATFPFTVAAETAPPQVEPEPEPVGTKLSWAPPTGWESYPVRNLAATTGFQTISGSGDVRLVAPNSTIGPVRISGFRNVVWIGGSARALPSATVNGADQRLVYIINCTGTVHLEGLYLDGAVDGAETDGITANGNTLVMQVQNVHVNGLRGGQTPHNHADVFQTYLGCRRLRFDRLTGSSNYQGIKFQLTDDATINMTEVTIRNTNIIGSDWTPTYQGGFMLWHDPRDRCPITYDNVYVDPRGTRSFGQSVWPGVTNSTNPVQLSGTSPNQVGRWPNMRVTGEVREGTPPDGDFCPAGTVGVGYVSPGYVGESTPTPTPPPATTTTTGGSGGSLTDQTFVSFTDTQGITSSYHVFAGGLDWSRPVGCMIYGDGSGEFGLYNPSSAYLLGGAAGLIATAKKHNMVLLTPMAPGTGCPDGGGVCWYQTSSGISPVQKAAWSRAVVDRVYSLYNLDRSRIVLGGYSSGAQWLTEYFGPAHAAQVMDDGVAVAISYGGSPKVAAQHTTVHRSAVPYVWDTGDQDPAWTNQSSVYGVKAGYDWYTNAGFTTALTLIAGEDHYRDGQFAGVVDREASNRLGTVAQTGTYTATRTSTGMTWSGAVKGTTSITVRASSSPLSGGQQGFYLTVPVTNGQASATFTTFSAGTAYYWQVEAVNPNPAQQGGHVIASGTVPAN